MKKFSVKEKAYAKVNLTLDVKKKRPDGYHELEGIMQSVSLADEVEARPGEGIKVVFDSPVPENNTCRRAAELFLAGSGLGAEISVRKRIPSEAGLGGASADAAAALRALNKIYAGTPLERTEDELLSIGLKIGADVPFCLTGGCAVARGVGEILTPVGGMSLDLLIVRGSRGVSTGRLFASLGVGEKDESRLPEGTLQNALAAIEKKDARALGACVSNALTPAACLIAPEIGEYAARMKALGALGASMTGSGAAVFGIFPDAESAKKAYDGFADCEFRAACKTKSGIWS
ncbi:MAG: 4-(cytidine 5'-diphospho)-2-C-methyl-D-erythritol kinase [Clostridia bacterium]|nr:4-(cytidine 5'-diphospho)-2-C-methyl-D-erythritol kinase [Clostridia bacterium]